MMRWEGRKADLPGAIKARSYNRKNPLPNGKANGLASADPEVLIDCRTGRGFDDSNQSEPEEKKGTLTTWLLFHKPKWGRMIAPN